MKIPKPIQQKQKLLRDQLWPNIDENRLWLRQKKEGFTTIPRPMSLIIFIMDGLSKNKPLGATYLELWGRLYEDAFLNISKNEEIAFNSGFSGQRGLRTWRERLKILKDLGFVDIKKGPAGEYSYVLIYNPYLVIKEIYKKGNSHIPEDRYTALTARSLEIGGKDLLDEVANEK